MRARPAHTGVRGEPGQAPPGQLDRPAAGAKPVTVPITLVLPAPLGPMRPTIWPGSTRSDTSLTATTPP